MQLNFESQQKATSGCHAAQLRANKRHVKCEEEECERFVFSHCVKCAWHASDRAVVTGLWTEALLQMAFLCFFEMVEVVFHAIREYSLRIWYPSLDKYGVEICSHAASC